MAIKTDDAVIALMEKKESANFVGITGTIIGSKIEPTTYKNGGGGSLKGNIIVSVAPKAAGGVTNDVEVFVEVNKFEYGTTNLNAKYTALEKDLSNFESGNYRVTINARMVENKFEDRSNPGTLISVNRIKMTKYAKPDTGVEDCSTFKFGGIITKAVTEKNIEITDENGNKKMVEDIKLEMCQCGYKATDVHKIVLAVEPENMGVRNGVKTCVVGETIIFSGNVEHKVTRVRKETEARFGDNIVEIVDSRRKSLFINSAVAVASESDRAFSPSDTDELGKIRANKLESIYEYGRSQNGGANMGVTISSSITSGAVGRGAGNSVTNSLY